MSDDVDVWRRIEERAIGQRNWLLEHHPEVFEEQKHLNSGSVERAYWHYGSQSAMLDIIKALTGHELRDLKGFRE